MSVQVNIALWIVPIQDDVELNLAFQSTVVSIIAADSLTSELLTLRTRDISSGRWPGVGQKSPLAQYHVSTARTIYMTT